MPREDVLKYLCATEPSCWPLSGNKASSVWFTTIDAEHDYQTGDEIFYSFWVKDPQGREISGRHLDKLHKLANKR